MISLNGWNYEHKNFFKSNGKYTVEIRGYYDYDCLRYDIFVVRNKDKKERMIHLLDIDNKPVLHGDCELSNSLNRAQEFFDEIPCVQDEIFKGGVDF